MPNRPRTPLEKIYSTDYDMSLNEKIAGAALKQYFLAKPEESRNALGEVIKKQTFIWNPKTPDKPILLAANIDAPALVRLIDTAAKYAAAVSVQNGAEAEDPAFHLTAAVAASLVDGEATVANVSQGFCDYLTDCCAAMFQ